MSYDLVLAGDVVLPDRVIRNGGLAISEGRIVSVLESTVGLEAREVREFPEQLLLPGGVDPHVHAYSGDVEPEGFARLTRGAAAGGITTVLDMPYDRPRPLTTPGLFRDKLDRLEAEALVDVGLYGTVPKYDGHLVVGDLALEGVCAFKLSTYETDPVRFPEITSHELTRILPEIAKTGLVVVFHAEDAGIIDPLLEQFNRQDVQSPLDHAISRPLLAENLAVVKVLELAKAFPVKVHIAHLTSPRGYEVIATYRDQGVDATAEICLHYLVFSQTELLEHGAHAKCNPPLRDEVTRGQLWELLLGGCIDFVTSDHVPWSKPEKSEPRILDNKSGLPGVQTLLPVLFSEAVVKRGLALPEFGRLVAYNPARRFGLAPRKGVLAVGADADICVLNPKEEWTVETRALEAVSDLSPYDGLVVTGRVTATYVRGTAVFADGQFLESPGFGELQRPVR